MKIKIKIKKNKNSTKKTKTVTRMTDRDQLSEKPRERDQNSLQRWAQRWFMRRRLAARRDSKLSFNRRDQSFGGSRSNEVEAVSLGCLQ
jgi:hypothetical protein